MSGQEVCAGERCDESVGGVREKLIWRAELAELSVDDDAHVVGDRHRVLVVVGDDQRWQVELAQQLRELAAHRCLGVGVERGERLVQQQHSRVAGERAGERDALAFPAGELVWTR